MQDDEVRWLDAEEQSAWRQYVSGSTLVFRELERRLLDNHGLSMDDYAILVLLSESPDGRLRMSEIADLGIIARPGVTYRITRLEKRGIVARCPLEDGDRRGVVAQLSDAGFALLEKAARDHVTSVREHVLDPLTREEFVRLGEIMGKIYAAETGDEVPAPRRA